MQVVTNVSLIELVGSLDSATELELELASRLDAAIEEIEELVRDIKRLHVVQECHGPNTRG